MSGRRRGLHAAIAITMALVAGCGSGAGVDHSLGNVNDAGPWDQCPVTPATIPPCDYFDSGGDQSGFRQHDPQTASQPDSTRDDHQAALDAGRRSESGSNRQELVGSAAESGTVVEVTDGDTIEVATSSGLLEVRVLGIDTPEVYFGEECWGAEASAFAERVLAGERVRLRTDPTQDRVDKYGRALRYVILPDGSNYSILAAEAGAARAYVYNNNPVLLHPEIVAAENRAQAADRGLWGPPCNGGDTVQTHEPAPAPEPDVPDEPDAGSGAGGIPPPPPDLDCSDVNGPIQVAPGDPHRFDGDGDGVGCESG